MAGLLAGDTALVTGAARGIGRAIAEALAAEGARLLATDVSPEVASVARALGGGAQALETDLSTIDNARALAEEAIRRLGSVSVFVHAAAPTRRETQTALAVSEAEWRQMIAVSLDAAFFLGQALGRHMKDARLKGRMLYITSLHAYAPRNLPHYSASKAGQTMVMKELARALGPHGIRVNAIQPGAIPSGGPQAGPELVPRIPLRRTGTPAEVAAMALAVLSERFGSYVSGASIAVDGGLALYDWIDARE